MKAKEAAASIMISRYKRQQRQIEKSVWMITYSDMVTLLLCFFILMYASSTVDNSKWQILVRSLNPSASVVSNVINEMSEGEDTDLISQNGYWQQEDIETMDELYWQMQNYAESNNLQSDVEVRGGDGYIFIVFRNNIFFDGDSYVLKPEGQVILDYLCGGLARISDIINEIRILGHTNQADPNNPNEPRGDRFLASNRATEVLVYMQEKNIFDPKRLVSIGYGQFYPAAPFIEEEDRLRNRRVEILITETGAIDVSLEQIYADSSGLNGAPVPASGAPENIGAGTAAGVVPEEGAEGTDAVL